MCTSFAKDLKRWTCDEELASRDAMLVDWAQALHEAAQIPPSKSERGDASTRTAGAPTPGTTTFPAASTDDPPLPVPRPVR